MTESSLVSIGVGAFAIIAGGVGSANWMMLKMYASISKIQESLQSHIREFDHKVNESILKHDALDRHFEATDARVQAHGENIARNDWRLDVLERSHEQNMAKHCTKP